MWLWFHTIPDEIGPMELKSKEFVDVVENLLGPRRESNCSSASEPRTYINR